MADDNDEGNPWPTTDAAARCLVLGRWDSPAAATIREQCGEEVLRRAEHLANLSPHNPADWRPMPPDGPALLYALTEPEPEPYRSAAALLRAEYAEVERGLKQLRAFWVNGQLTWKGLEGDIRTVSGTWSGRRFSGEHKTIAPERGVDPDIVLHRGAVLAPQLLDWPVSSVSRIETTEFVTRVAWSDVRVCRAELLALLSAAGKGAACSVLESVPKPDRAVVAVGAGAPELPDVVSDHTAQKTISPVEETAPNAEVVPQAPVPGSEPESYATRVAALLRQRMKDNVQEKTKAAEAEELSKLLDDAKLGKRRPSAATLAKNYMPDYRRPDKSKG